MAKPRISISGSRNDRPPGRGSRSASFAPRAAGRSHNAGDQRNADRSSCECGRGVDDAITSDRRLHRLQAVSCSVDRRPFARLPCCPRRAGPRSTHRRIRCSKCSVRRWTTRGIGSDARLYSVRRSRRAGIGSDALTERGAPANRAPVAQWIEHLTSDQRVGGSNPSGRATFPRETARLFEAEGHRTACSGTIRHRDCYIDCYMNRAVM